MAPNKKPLKGEAPEQSSKTQREKNKQKRWRQTNDKQSKKAKKEESRQDNGAQEPVRKDQGDVLRDEESNDHGTVPISLSFSPVKLTRTWYNSERKELVTRQSKRHFRASQRYHLETAQRLRDQKRISHDQFRGIISWCVQRARAFSPSATKDRNENPMLSSATRLSEAALVHFDHTPWMSTSLFPRTGDISLERH